VSLDVSLIVKGCLMVFVCFRIEWRFAVDPSINPAIVRVSVGLEAFKDLKNDFLNAFKIISKE
jgi:cystathionine beta-lyase/cystathionine gamma-synthase